MLAALALLATPAAAATLPQWTGPGDRGCHGRCPVEWALEQLPEATRAEVVTAMRRAPVPVLVRDGDYLSLMTYHAGGPVAQHGVVAVLDAPEPATGWCIEGGCFVQVHGCANWAMTTNTNVAAGGVSPVVAPSRGGAVATAPALFGRAGQTWPVAHQHGHETLHASALAWGATLHRSPARAHVPSERPTRPIPPVPLPSAVWLLLSALVALIALRRDAGPGRRPLGHSSLSPAGPSGPALFRGRR